LQAFFSSLYASFYAAISNASGVSFSSALSFFSSYASSRPLLSLVNLHMVLMCFGGFEGLFKGLVSRKDMTNCDGILVI
jgi:hypothetical protein